MDDKPRTTIRKPARIDRGHCFCGAITAEFSGDPFWICFDHDDDCRRAIGSPLTIWIGYRPDQVHWLGPKPKTSRKPGASCAPSVRNVAPRLGTPMKACQTSSTSRSDSWTRPRSSIPKPRPIGKCDCRSSGWMTVCLASRATPERATPPWAIPETGEAGGWISGVVPASQRQGWRNGGRTIGMREISKRTNARNQFHRRGLKMDMGDLFSQSDDKEADV